MSRTDHITIERGYITHKDEPVGVLSGEITPELEAELHKNRLFLKRRVWRIARRNGYLG